MDNYAKEPKRILRSTFAKSAGTSETGKKRLKTSCREIKQLQGTFRKTIQCKLPKNINVSRIEGKIRAQLRDKHYAVVTGDEDSHYTEIAVDAIKGMGYADERCVEMLKPSDWSCIDPDDIDLVLCKEPLKSVCTDKVKIKQMTDIFDCYLSRKPSDDNSYKNVDIVILVNSTVLCECREKILSNIFEEAINVSGATTEDKPNKGKGKARKDVRKKKPQNKVTVTATGSETRYYDKEHPSIRSIMSKHEYTISLSEDTSIGWITGCCLLPSGEIILADFYNRRLKKLDRNYQIFSTCELPSVVVGMCYTGENQVVVSLGEKLQFANVTADIKLTTLVDIDTYCKGLTSHDSNIYIVNEKTVFIYATNGRFIRELYTNDSREAYFQGIAVSNDGQRIYISSWTMGLITIDSSGNHLHTLYDDDLKAPFGICVDDRSNVFMCLTGLGCVIQLSSDGRQRLGEVVKKTDSVPSPRSLYFDRKTSSLIVGCGGGNKIYILELS